MIAEDGLALQLTLWVGSICIRVIHDEKSCSGISIVILTVHLLFGLMQEFLALPRADAIHLLGQYNGNAEMVIQQLFA